MCWSGARACRAAAMGACQWACLLEDPSMVPGPLCSSTLGSQIWKKSPRSGQLQVLPSRRLATNEMSLGVFQLLFMQSFLWNAGIGWTIPKRTSCECLALIKPPLLHKHSPSCWNLILKHFSAPIVKQTSWRGLLTSWPSAAFQGW